MDGLELKKRALSGALWNFMERIGAQLVSMIVSVILARLLTPDDYSIVGIVSIFFTFCNVFITGGFNAALIRKKDADTVDYSSVLYISLGIALVMYGFLFFSAPLIAQFYNNSLLVPVFRVMGIVLIINGVKSVVCAYISNKLQFKLFFFATFGGTVISAFVGIGMAIAGFGPWALVAQNLTNSLIGTIILCVATKFKPVLVISWNKIADLFGYGWKIFVSSIISVAYDEILPLIIGAKFSGADLSFYTKGKAYPSMINSSVNGTLSAVLFPVMSKVQDDTDAILRYTRRFIQVSSFVVFPGMIGFAVISDNFVSLLLTDKWLPAADYIKIFCFCYMFSIVQDGNLQTIRAIGRSDVILRMEIIKKALYLLVIVCAIILFDNPLLLAATTLINTVIATVVNTIPNRKLIGYRLRLQVSDILPNLLVSLVMGTAVYSMNAIAIPKLPLLLLQILCGGVLYVALNLLVKNPCMGYLLGTLKRSGKEKEVR